MEELKILAQQKVRVKIGDELLTFKKITLGDYADLQAYAKAEYIKEELETARAFYGEDIPDALKEDIRKSITPEKIDKLCESHKSLSFLVARALKPSVAGITPEDVAQMSMDMLEKVMDAIAPPDETEKKRKRGPVKKSK